MVRLSFAKDVKTAVKGADTLLVVAPQRAYDPRRFPKLTAPKIQKLILELAKDTKPGDLGQTASTLTGGTPRRVVVGVLPNSLSRYNAPSRPEPIQRSVSAAGLTRAKRATIVLILDEESHLVAAVNAVGRAFPEVSKKSEAPPSPRIQIVAIDPKGELIKITTEAREVLSAARSAAGLVDAPPTELNPEALASQVRALLADTGAEVEELSGNDLLKNRLNGIHAVGRAATSLPRMIVARWSPKTPSGVHVALVGKGITFDTGGLHLKARGSMETMKSDMGGAAAVTGAFRVLTRTGCPHQLSLVVCIAENAIGPNAYKPDDVIEMHSGKTVEINNTDAEGRLLLADGVSWAARVLEASHVLDAATLTGAQLIATGTQHAAVVSNDGDLETLLVNAGRASGDLVHPLPFAPELFKSEFKSPLADMRNSVKNRANAQASCAAQFVYNHLDDTDVKWAHVDLAGPAFRNERGTGFGVALLAEAVRRIT